MTEPVSKKSPLKLILALALFIFTVALLGYTLFQNNFFISESVTTTAPEKKEIVELPSVDIALIYSHIREGKDYAAEIERAVLEEYDRRNKKSDPAYRNGRIAADVFACWATGGDFYGESILHIAEVYAHAAWLKGSHDALVLSICDVYTFADRYSNQPSGAEENLGHVRKMAASDYPALCKLFSAMSGMHNLGSIATADDSSLRKSMAPVVAKLPALLGDTLTQYEALAKTHPPDNVLYRVTQKFFDSCEGSDESLAKAGPAVGKILTGLGASEALRDLCEGDFLIDWAWAARGDGWASEVTAQGGKLMQERLADADEVLTAAAEKFPKDARIPALTINVELGQGMGKYRMERLFSEAMAADPNCYSACRRKIYYLQPKWYGSPDEVMHFGEQCVATGRWEAKIPMVLFDGLKQLESQIDNLYRYEQVWKPLESTFTEYLHRYPTATYYRTQYARCAGLAGKWQIVKEQLKILGHSWDPEVLDSDEYHSLQKESASHG